MNRDSFLNKVKEKLDDHNRDLNPLCKLEDLTSPVILSKGTKTNLVYEKSILVLATKDYIEF